MDDYKYLFSQGKIGKLTVKNRILMAPMATNFAMQSGEVSQRLIDYYVERARGGVGLIIVENANIDYPMGRNGAIQLRIDDDAYIPGLGALCDAIHESDTEVRVALQLSHAGASTRAARIGGKQPVGPSDIQISPNHEIPRQLELDEIKDIVRKFGLAALRAKRAGFDAVEIHGANAYLLAEFISPWTNKRTDIYGGSIENRLRFPLEVVRRIREAVGREFPILFRMNGDEFMSGALTLDEAMQNARILEQAGVNLLHITAGNGYTHERHVEPPAYKEAWKTYLARAIKNVVQIPVAAVGVIRSPETAEAIIKKGDADFVAIGRGLIADPFWPRKAQSGKVASIRRCISCLTCVSRRVSENLAICCALNPAAGREAEMRVLLKNKAVAKKKIAVVGGGPAGMYVSSLLKKLSHDVTLYESEEQMGGQLRIASVPPYKDKIDWFVEYLKYEVEVSGVNVKLGTKATAKMLQESGADIVILATGSIPFIPPIPGIDIASVLTAHEILARKKSFSNLNIVVVGGGSVGCETAEYLAKTNNVKIVEMREEIAVDLKPLNKVDLLKHLRESEIETHPKTLVENIDRDKVNCYSIGSDGSETRKSFKADLVVIATGSIPLNNLLKEINQPGLKVVSVGDCVKPGQIIDLLRQGVTLAKHLALGSDEIF